MNFVLNYGLILIDVTGLRATGMKGWKPIDVALLLVVLCSFVSAIGILRGKRWAWLVSVACTSVMLYASACSALFSWARLGEAQDPLDGIGYGFVIGLTGAVIFSVVLIGLILLWIEGSRRNLPDA